MMRADIRWREPKQGVDAILAAGADAWAESGGSAEHATALLRAWWRGRKNQYAAGLREYSRVDELGQVFRIGTLASPAGRGSGRYSVLHPTTGLPVKLPPGDWAAPASTMSSYISEGRVHFGPDETTMPYRRLYLNEQLDGVPLPVFRQSRASGTQHLARVFSGEQRFSHPKDHLVLARWFKMMAGPDALFLDFYAGSGTTAEAVMHLNAEDGGTRRAIVVTSNEVWAAEHKTLAAAGHAAGDVEWEARGVYRRVCRPRIETIVTGVREDGSRFSDGFKENVSFYRAG